MTPQALKQLQSMAAQVEKRDLAALRMARDRLDRLQAAQAALDATQADLYGAESLVVGAAYGDWLHLELARLRSAIARAEAALETARTGAGRSFARRQLLDGLLKHARYEGLMQERRRAEQNGMPPER